ncbi:PIN domain-containing protein [Halorubrum halodurans]|uniref:Twitching motility protein PilT n=1 Tax=Halorubrum halodurans TaxID=1383851 RepID=A0A256IAI9_9EURY|nr:twitching motility protein PilT [Halorubrum halodurans]OYR53511.1 twitching motility protein PilT [Halorubrum halodurans]
MSDETPGGDHPVDGDDRSADAGDRPTDADDRPVVALDASALMAPVEADVRLFEELDRLLGSYDPVVPSAVVEELDGLGSGAGKAATAASVGADLADRARTIDVEGAYADDGLVELARSNRVAYVVTLDRPLVERVLDADTPVICLRGRNTLTVTDP